MENLCSVLSTEHQIILGRLDDLERALDGKSKPGVQRVLAFFDLEVALHRRKEEEILFPELARHFPPEMGPVGVMLGEHQQERSYLDAIRLNLSAGPWNGGVESNGRNLLILLRNHIWKEDNVLFQMADSILDDAAKARVKAGFESIGTFAPSPTPVSGGSKTC